MTDNRKAPFRTAPAYILAAACLVLLGACKMPLISPEMIDSAKHSGGLVAASSNKSVTLSWVEDPTAAEYVLRYTRNGSVPSEGNGETLASVRPPLTLAGLKNGDLHLFSLKATYRNGTVKDIGTVRSIPLASTTLAPQATGEIGQIRVRWPSISATSEFLVQRRTGTTGDFVQLGLVSGCEYVDRGLAEDQVYWYRIMPANGSEVPSAANAARTAFPATAPRIESSIATSKDALDVERSGDAYAYLSNGSNGLKVLNLDADGKPTFVRDVAFPAGLTNPTARSISASGSWLCVAADSGLAWYNIADPSNPSLPQARVTNVNPAFAVKVSGNFAYVACLDSGIKVVNLTTGVVSAAPDFGLNMAVTDIDLCNGYIVAAFGPAGSNKLRSFSIDPTTGALTLAGTVNLPAIGVDKRLAVSGTTVFVSIEQTFYAVSLATPSTPSVVKTVDFKPQVAGMSVTGNRLLVFSFFNNLVYDYDISDPAKLFLNTTYEMPARPTAAVAKGSRLLVASSGAGLQVLFDSRLYLRQASWAKTADYGAFYGRDVKIRGELCYLVGSGSLSIADISSPNAPRVLSRLDLPATAMGIVLSGDYAYVTSSSGALHVVDVSDPAAPRIASTAVIAGKPAGVAVFGDRAFVTNESSQLQVVDISDPVAAASTGETVKLLDQSGSDITVDGSMAYLAAGTYYGQLQCVDLSKPTGTATSVALVSQTPGISGAYSFARDYIDGAMGLHVTNVSDPLKPSKLGYAPCPYLGAANAPNIQGNVAVSGGFAYAVAWGIGVQRFSVANAAAPSYLASFSGTSSYDVDVSGSLCVVARSLWPVGEGIEIWSMKP